MHACIFTLHPHAICRQFHRNHQHQNPSGINENILTWSYTHTPMIVVVYFTWSVPLLVNPRCCSVFSMWFRIRFRRRVNPASHPSWDTTSKTCTENTESYNKRLLYPSLFFFSKYSQFHSLKTQKTWRTSIIKYCLQKVKNQRLSFWNSDSSTQAASDLEEKKIFFFSV